MRVSTSRALACLRETYRELPLWDRVHILGRFASCPFLRVLDHVPTASRVLDVGAGHGLFATLALDAGAALVVAVEPDLRKVLLVRGITDARWIAAYDDAVRARFDIVTMFDVLYRIPLEDRDELFERLRVQLRPGGRILIKELDPERPVKFAWNRAQEWISDRLLGLTLGTAFAYESRQAIGARLLRAGFSDFRAEEIDRSYPHSHILYTATRP